MTRDRSESEEVVQDAFPAVWSKMGRVVRTELDLVPPYDVFLQVRTASSPRYELAGLTVRVPRSLGHPISHHDIVHSLWKGGSIAVIATCDGAKFVATQVTVPGGP